MVVSAREPEFGEFRAVQESLSGVHPRMRARWLRERGLDDSYYTTFRKPESTGLRCIGRWPWGPSWELCGRDSLLFLGSGSGVRILSIADSTNPRMLGQINARGLVSQLVVQDSLLFVACGSWGAQVYSVADPANPRELGSMDVVTFDLAVVDTFCYTVGNRYSPNDSLRIFNVADPAQPRQTGAVRDTGNLIVAANGHVFVAGTVANMNVYDVRDPTAPQWVNSRGGQYLTFFVRRRLLLCSDTQPGYFAILDISNPLAIAEVGRINGYGGRALYADDWFAYLSCGYDHSGLYIIDISDSTHPQVRGSLDPEGVSEYDPFVPRPLSYGYLADHYGGLVVVDLHDVNAPTEAWSGYKASQALDLDVDSSRMYVAGQYSGLHVLDVTDPAAPSNLGQYDLVGSKATRAVVARDSFAFISMTAMPRRHSLQVLSVMDPANPVVVGSDSCYNPPRDYYLEDTLIYAAEDGRFQIFNVARPREPVLVGSCMLPYDSYDLDVQDSLAFVGNVTSLRIVNIARPQDPVEVGHWGQYTLGVDAVDTVAYAAVALPDGVLALSVANPSAPYVLDSLSLGVWPSDIVVVDSLAFASDDVIYIINVSNPRDLRLIGTWSSPGWIRRLLYAPPYLFAACSDAGVCVLELVNTGVAEKGDTGAGRVHLRLLPTVVSDRLVVDLGGHTCRGWTVHDVVGRVVAQARLSSVKRMFHVELGSFTPGVYVFEAELIDGGMAREKFVKR